MNRRKFLAGLGMAPAAAAATKLDIPETPCHENAFLDMSDSANGMLVVSSGAVGNREVEVTVRATSTDLQTYPSGALKPCPDCGEYVITTAETDQTFKGLIGWEPAVMVRLNLYVPVFGYKPTIIIKDGDYTHVVTADNLRWTTNERGVEIMELII
jgi:predicted RNA-binding Zn-ribbon protein involved in translation (DUF1610 family)